MNRHGSILEANVDGGIAGFDNFLDGLVDRFVRPFAESLFPANVGPGDSKGRFIFTVKYEHHAEEEGTPRRVYDIKLAEHRDASVVTMNVNLNTDSFQGSALEFIDDAGHRKELKFRPGEVIIHLGSYRHAVLPITDGHRENMIIWLFGAEGEVRVAPYKKHEQLTLEQRWGGGGIHSDTENEL
jgi:hypothetical protein